MKFGILTVNDTCFKGENIVDESGPTLKELIKSHYADGFISEHLVPNEIDQIKNKLIEWSDNEYDVILTTGGTGISPRDVTPEATKAVVEKEIPGIVFAMLGKSLQMTPFVMLSRAVTGIRNKSLIINLPGSVKAVIEHFEIIYRIIPHAVALIKDEKIDVTKHHEQMQNQTTIEPSKVKGNCVADRNRVSKYKMIEVSDALKIVLSYCGQTSETEIICIDDAFGRVLAEEVRSLDPLPPFRVSIKDGYAVKYYDGKTLRRVCDAGDNPNAFCVRIGTGVPVPPGTEGVIQIENTRVASVSKDLSEVIEITILKWPQMGQNIREIGSDMAAFAIVLNKGSVLNAPEIEILAAVGKTKISVYKIPTVGVISIGNEIQDDNEQLKTGKIRDSNKITLMNLLKQYGQLAVDYGVARDNPTSVKSTLAKAFEQCEFIITSGGVSMDEFDLIQKVLIQDFNATIHFGRINMKLGESTTFATCLYKGNIKTIFALPGNPVSAKVTCFLFAIPALRFRINRNIFNHDIIQVATNDTLIGDKERPDYQRVKFIKNNGAICYLNVIPQVQNCNHTGHYLGVVSTGGQRSSKLNSFAGADGLMLIPTDYNGNGPFDCYLFNKY